MNDEESRGRADALSARRKVSKSQAGEESESAVKSERVGTYMYISHDQKKELDRLYKLLSAEYEYKYEEGLEKNRHFYSLIVEYGIKGLDGLDASEIRDRLEDL